MAPWQSRWGRSSVKIYGMSSGVSTVRGSRWPRTSARFVRHRSVKPWLRSMKLWLALALVGLLTLGSNAVSPVSAQSESVWLNVVNEYRAIGGLTPVTDSPDASSAAALHSSYMVQNRALVHAEDPSRPGYTAEGSRAGATGNVILGTGPLRDERWIIENWMAAPFHGIGMIQPGSTSFGFGKTEVAPTWASTLSVVWDSPSPRSSVDLKAFIAQGVAAVKSAFPELAGKGHKAKTDGKSVTVTITGRVFTVRNGIVTEGGSVASQGKPLVVWPGAGSATSLLQFKGPEFPDPLSACGGYSASTGAPIYVSRGKPTEITQATLTDSSGESNELCVLSALSYTNPSASAQQLGRAVLAGYGAVALLPRNPLVPGRVYTVDVITRDAQQLKWEFSATNSVSRAGAAVSNVAVAPLR